MLQTIINIHVASILVLVMALVSSVSLPLTQASSPIESDGPYVPMVQQLITVVEDKMVSNETAVEALLKEYVSFPSIAAMYEQHGDDTLACANWLRDVFERELGMKDARLIPGGYRYPIVVGSTDGPDSTKPAVIIYGHYDIQPVDPVHLWDFPPFEMQKMKIDGYGEVFTGRGSSDNKGNSFAPISALMTLQQAIIGGLKSLPINIIMAIEGEEEIGSEGFRSFLEDNAEVFKNAQFVINSDAGQNSLNRGALLLSMRGMMGAQIDVKGANTDLHSGTYGGMSVS